MAEALLIFFQSNDFRFDFEGLRQIDRTCLIGSGKNDHTVVLCDPVFVRRCIFHNKTAVYVIKFVESQFFFFHLHSLLFLVRSLFDAFHFFIRMIFPPGTDTGERENFFHLFVLLKQGKSELAAAVALLLLCGDGEERAEVYGCAADRKAASISRRRTAAILM